MKLVVIGGSGLIGARLTAELRARGHDAVPASRRTGVDVVTGTGLAGALAGADVVVDATDTPSFEPQAAYDFFTTATTTLLAAERAAGVGHHVTLSIVGIDRSPQEGYRRAKVAQEELVVASGVRYTILRATQFFEFLRAIADGSTTGDEVRVTSAALQPVAADEVVALLADLAVAPPRDGVVELAGPQALGLDVLVGHVLAAAGDRRTVVADPAAGYFGALIDDTSLTAGPGTRLGVTTLAQWLGAAA
ncbi:LysR family transcriptional regulator [Cellulomonas chitinilytica]|uniref:LysR family transcriptional regulator n=1 Tax=Cellulomonas chitinilytica TaxID=398759 RepID=A0A919P621_9CELL|nr:SDR family oxidoreductase [Cellulomonas chitinilytica]GIG21659.1 LysR family transcriptional regulator [Cellulomonas chitinilytica]